MYNGFFSMPVIDFGFKFFSKLRVYRFRVNDYASFLAAKIASASSSSHIFVYRIGTIHYSKTYDLIWNFKVFIKILSCTYLPEYTCMSLI